MGMPFHLPDNSQNQQWFRFAGGVFNAPVFQTWYKPAGISMVHMFALDAGAGGGGGFSGATSTQRGGGSGGAAGCNMSMIIPAAFLPDLLYIFVPQGGRGCAAGTGGAGQTLSYGGASMIQVHTKFISGGNPPGMVLCSSSDNSAQPGNAGTASTGGAAAAHIIPATSFIGEGGYMQYYPGALYTTWTFPSTQAGMQGQAGSASGGPSGQIDYGTMGGFLTGGMGGAGCTSGNVDSAGGSINADAALTPWLPPGGIPGGAAGGGRGQNGLDGLLSFGKRPPYCTGGTGGGSNSAGVGGAGGKGGPGCGGGGGAGGITGGQGGDGGDGLVIVQCW